MILRGKEVLFERIFMEKLVLNKKRILRKNSWVSKKKKKIHGFYFLKKVWVPKIP